MRRQDKEQDDRQVIQRENAEDPSQEKISDKVFTVAGLKQYVCDQKAGKNKEEVNTFFAQAGIGEEAEIVAY